MAAVFLEAKVILDERLLLECALSRTLRTQKKLHKVELGHSELSSCFLKRQKLITAILGYCRANN